MAATPTGVTRSLDGRVDRVPQGSITFDKLREYVYGDELRHVHWRTTARIGELMVREHVDTSLPRLVVLLDDRAAAYGDAEQFEWACEAAASVIAAATRDDLPIELLLVNGDPGGSAGSLPEQRGRTFTGGRRTSHAGPLLDQLAEATLLATGQDDRLDIAINRLRQLRLGDTLVYLTGDGRPEDLASVGALRGAYPTIVAGLFGDPDRAPAGVADLRLIAVRDAEEFVAGWDGVGRW